MKFENYIDENYKNTILLSLIYEGVYDPSIFKAIFLAGGPGSGKSFVASQTTGGMGLKMVNSDTLFERMAKEAGISLKKMSFVGPDVKKRNAIRDRAKNLTDKQLDNYLNSRLGLVIDGTGRSYKKIEKQVKVLEKLGYDCFMVFVNTSLEVALERNEERSRSVPEDLVEEAWKAVQDNIGKFQTLFGMSNFKVVDNNVYTDDKAVFNNSWKEVMKFTKRSVDNLIAKQWIETALRRKTGSKKSPKEKITKGKFL